STLKLEGFEIEVSVAGHETGFIARKKSSKPGPTIGLLAEYDALIGLGHGCGHNIIGATSVLAGCSLGQIIEQTGGEVVVYGTPSEEGGDNGSAKASFVNAGLFENVDVCMMIHPGNRTAPTDTSLALHPLEFEFFGKPAHAAGCPENGVNALDAMILFFTGINALRQQLTPDIKIHGIITHGGDAPNIIPAYTKARFYVRANTVKQVDEVTDKVIAIAKGAALSTGCRAAHNTFQNKVEDLIVHPHLNQLFLEAANELKVMVDLSKRDSKGSTDAGNVSHVVPTIHPTLKICPETIVAHTEEFKAAAVSSDGDRTIITGANILANIGVELLTNPTHLEIIKAEFTQIQKNL
ncbi:MAG: M20 family metallopeptidase, partial [Turicibacter sp.]